MELTICPECRAGKHQNCDGFAWDNDMDKLTECQCLHTKHSGLTLAVRTF